MSVRERERVDLEKSWSDMSDREREALLEEAEDIGGRFGELMAEMRERLYGGDQS